MINDIVADAMVTQGAMASAAMVLATSSPGIF